jgi:site-specific DNA-methyltransferase (cytosine-N4-specific)
MELDADYVAGSALRFMDHLPESKVPETFGRVSAQRRDEAVDLSGPPTLFETPGSEKGSDLYS